MTTVSILAKDESMMAAEPTLPAVPSGTSLNPTPTSVMVMDFHNHLQSQTVRTPTPHPLKTRRWAVNC
jgi:hypothetical protein